MREAARSSHPTRSSKDRGRAHRMPSMQPVDRRPLPCRPCRSGPRRAAAAPVSSPAGSDGRRRANRRSRCRYRGTGGWRTRRVPCRPQSMPVPGGPWMALPPLKTTRSAPSSMKRRRFSRGGSCAAASTITGTRLALATLNHLLERRGRRLCGDIRRLPPFAHRWHRRSPMPRRRAPRLPSRDRKCRSP